MGVGVVVAAGWAVSDAAAEVFANALYSELLGGRTLMKAVSEARRRSYGAGGSGDLTWGAYQVYGDPGTMLHWAAPSGDESGPGDRSFVSPEKVVEYIGDFSPRGRGASDDKGLRDALLSELKRLEHELPEVWLARGGIRAAFGRAYADLAFYPEAIEHYRRAASQSDAPMETVEQLANIKGRYAARIATSDPTRAEELFHSSVKRLRGLCQAGDSSERRCLIGATLRRRARVTTNRKLRSQHIEEARSEYEAACRLKPQNLYYPLSNKVALDISLDPTRVDRADLEAIVASAESCDDEWSRAAKADAMLISFLALEEGNAEAAAQAYLRAMTVAAGATRRERDSMLDQVAALVDLALDEGVQQRAEQVRSALRRLF